MQHRLFFRLALTALLGVGMSALAAPAVLAAPAAPNTHAAAAATVIRQSGETAMAAFDHVQGDNSAFVQVSASPDGLMTPTGGSLSGPAVSVSITENSPTTCASFAGAASVPALRFTDLTAVTFPEVTMEVVPVGDPECPANGQPFDVTLGLTWTGVGNVTTTHVVDHLQVSPTATETVVLHGVTRDATVSGSVSYPSPLFGPLTLTGADASFVQLNNGGLVATTVEH